MARTGFTTTPCPGCGEGNERKKDSVCPECHSLLATGKLHRERYEALAGDENFIEMKLPEGWDKPRYSAYKVNNDTEVYDRIGDLMKEISLEISLQKGKRPHWGYMRHLENHLTFEGVEDRHSKIPVMFKEKDGFGNYEKYNKQQNAVIPKRWFDLLEELHKTIEKCIGDTEEKAVAYGKSALIMLNDGHITMSDFNKK